MTLATATTRTDASDRRALLHAFETFGSMSAQLSQTFDALRAQVAALQVELGSARAGERQLADRLSALVHGLPGGVLLLDGAGVIVEANSIARELLGEPLEGVAFAQVLTRAAVGPVGVEHVELRCGRSVAVSRRHTADGEVVLLTDVTEARLMQNLLARQQRLLTLGELAAGLAHQIRTPLATALLYASQMTMPGRNPEDLTRCAERTADSLRQLDRLVTDMLAFAHGGAARESVTLTALLEQVAQWLRPALRPGVRLTIRTQAPELKVRANAPSLVSAVLNLASNALQAADGELEVELLARRGEAGRAQILVSDTGPGVPEHLRARIFEPFFTTRARGNGIGLAIVKSVVEGHGGHVALVPSPRGAVFLLDLPAEVNS